MNPSTHHILQGYMNPKTWEHLRVSKKNLSFLIMILADFEKFTKRNYGRSKSLSPAIDLIVVVNGHKKPFKLYLRKMGQLIAYFWPKELFMQASLNII